MLRISDILVRNLVLAMLAKKKLPTLVDTIQSCGILSITLIFMTNDDKYYVYFTPKVWNAKDGQGGRSKHAYEWMSLRGHDRV